MKFMHRIPGILTLLFYVLLLQAQEKQIVLFTTNDMHAHITNFAKMGAYISDFRKTHPHVLVLSGGDMFSGDPVVDQYPDKGFPIVDLMNRVGYQFGTFGNHEFDYGQAKLQERLNQAKFPVICANMKMDPAVAQMKQPEATAFIDVDGIRIGMVGVIEASVHANGVRYPACHPDRVKGITFTDPVATIQQYRDLRNQCDLFLAISHAGYDADLKIADLMPELDAIVGAHTHTKIDTLLLRNGVLVTQTGCYMEYLGKLTFTFRDKKLVGRSYELIPFSSMTREDAATAKATKAFFDNSPMKEVLAEATEQLDGKEELGGLMCDAVVEVHHVDFAFQNSGGVRIGQIKKGPVTRQDVFSMDPFGNTVVLYDMSYKQLAEFLMNSYRKASKRADLLCSGLKYTIHTHDGVATRVDITDEAGKPLDPDKRYKVGMNSYISASYKFDKSGLVKESTDTASDALIQYLKNHKTVSKDKHRTAVVED